MSAAISVIILLWAVSRYERLRGKWVAYLLAEYCRENTIAFFPEIKTNKVEEIILRRWFSKTFSIKHSVKRRIKWL